jgi:hypothetical protein
MKILYNFCLGVMLIINASITACSFEYSLGKWENGKIIFFLSGNFNKNDISNIDLAMKTWEDVCGVQFEEITPRSSAYQITYVTDYEWSSSIGENNSKCLMEFGDGGDPVEHIIHELGHCLGLLHEHQRPDRDQYVQVFYQYIIPAYKFNFEIRNNPLYEEEEFEYDYHSVMHYPPRSFGINNAITIKSLGESISRIGTITELDAAKAKAIYGSPLEKPDYCIRFCK